MKVDSYLSEELRLKGPNEMYNPNLYKVKIAIRDVSSIIVVDFLIAFPV